MHLYFLSLKVRSTHKTNFTGEMHFELSALLLILIPVLVIKYKNKLTFLWSNRYIIYSMLLKQLSRSRVSENTIIFKENHAVITYYYEKNEFTLRVPYSPKHRLDFHKMILIKEASVEIVETDITHKYGIPYMLTARQLGGDYIVRRKVGGNITTFNIDEIPHV